MEETNEGDKLGYILDIKDKANISKLDRAACGIPRKALGTSKYVLWLEKSKPGME